MKLRIKSKGIMIAIMFAVVGMFVLSSCDDPDFQEGFKQGWNWATGQ